MAGINGRSGLGEGLIELVPEVDKVGQEMPLDLPFVKQNVIGD